MLLRLIERRRGGERGQGLAEVALVLPVFMLVVFGLFDVGKLVYTNSVLSQSAREGARLAATEAAWVGRSGAPCAQNASQVGPVCPTDVAALKSDVVQAVNRMVAAVGPISAVHVSCNAGDVADPAPSGDWTDASGGNGCADGSGVSLGASGELVSVRVELDYQPITPIISSLISTVPLSGSATMVVH